MFVNVSSRLMQPTVPTVVSGDSRWERRISFRRRVSHPPSLRGHLTGSTHGLIAADFAQAEHYVWRRLISRGSLSCLLYKLKPLTLLRRTAPFSAAAAGVGSHSASCCSR